MLKYFKAQITNIPPTIKEVDRRIYVFSALIYLTGLLVHCLLLAFFASVQANVMSVYNVISIVSFVYCYILNRQGHLKTAFTIMVAEITLHSAMSVHFIGWSSGFQFFIMFIPPIIFINSTLSTIGKIIYAAIVTLSFAAIYYFYQDVAPVYVLSNNLRDLVYLVSLVSVFLTFCFLGYFFSLAVTNAEKNLHLANNELTMLNGDLYMLNEEMKDKNEKIISSINYAKTLQSAILAKENELVDALPGSYLMFMPKDYVSGDFYWFKEVGINKFIVAVADCTGHGVPGAMISVVGNMILNEVILNAKKQSPAIILNLLNNRVRAALKQDEEDSYINDGMDISVCLLDMDTMEMTFASAKRPIILLRNNKYEIIHSNKHSVGGRRSIDAVFTEEVINIEKDDRILLFSDGITDQNDKDRKKLGLKTLGEMCVANPSKEAILENFTKFIGDEEQRDDITLVSVKI